MPAFLMVDYTLPEAIQQIQQQIDAEDLYINNDPESSISYGLELSPHLTLAPCLRNNTKLDNVKKFLQPLENYRLELTGLTVFENRQFDVLVCNVKRCNPLFETNSEISEHYKLKNQFKFNPHVTVAYLKKDKGKKYAELPFPNEVTMEPKCFSYSHSEGERQVKEEFCE